MIKQEEKVVAHLYNSALAAWSIGAAWEIGALDELLEHGSLSIQEFCLRNNFHEPSIFGMFRSLAVVDIVDIDGAAVTPAVNFTEVCRTRSFFHWLTRGSGELFRQLPTLVRKENRVGNFYRRDAEAIAVACREIDAISYGPHFWDAMADSGSEFRAVADLGCGSGDRIIQILKRYPDAQGVGIDIAKSAVELARVSAESASVASRVTFVEADILAMKAIPLAEEVEVVTCFMAGHDFWPRMRCIETLTRIRKTFPNARRLILGDATRSVGVDDKDLPIFALSFQFAHDLMAAFIPTIEDWNLVFEESVWKVHNMRSINIAVNEVIFELVAR